MLGLLRLLILAASLVLAASTALASSPRAPKLSRVSIDVDLSGLLPAKTRPLRPDVHGSSMVSSQSEGPRAGTRCIRLRGGNCLDSSANLAELTSTVSERVPLRSEGAGCSTRRCWKLSRTVE
ncbi:hypothetical protein GUITHDRAFT_166401 [Guillardia theta CCMP2712]|uniref:Uncharacterized protein n=1 Tax=Guillardia theta (strain CCMP2712) TaxID=905079 RepID=L1IC49_GUITC|nr:hypothetical protein GUITHDRAFT_166400 [Guillardia theta CCMP2712]XP_005820659.1 hypothetical protein GUITHDRAFT_166401 [Guillardia theta CCMP2712]EKX33677.1 hypothetical protein GUITHDRAFT_166400 [Guillardia theta CCMP2712]EKX33679.1 hypothetical protein GUITHDRAFT_166401 [Guillardia theta CCMP2712]|mmetsp:Transcript_3642/g.12947  ORF Transcript_3642/g.12947 Transcript_3642/m.12947 type:complete len:123 (+) Transcript_3642:199-567(+)|eukprot:XP_005820657.1 hypothetical protein GUITHDRAFT_166400 [Guillardia theta CCMP2712]